MPLDPREIKLDDIITKVMSLVENASSHPFQLTATAFNKDIEYGLFRPDDIAELFARHASDYQRRVLPKMYIDVETAVAHFHGSARATEVVETLKSRFPERVSIGDFARIVGDPKLVKIFTEPTNRRQFIPASHYDADRPSIVPVLSLPDLGVKQSKRASSMRIIPRDQSFEAFVENRRLKASDIINAIHNPVTYEMNTVERVLSRLPVVIAGQKRYVSPALKAKTLARVIEDEISPQDWRGLTEHIAASIAKKQGGIVAPPHKVNMDNLADELALLQLFRKAREGISPTGLSSHGKAVPTARVKGEHIGSPRPR